MILVTAATEFEMNALLGLSTHDKFCHLITGVGPIQTAATLSRFLSQRHKEVSGIINFGVGGAFFPSKMERTEPQILDLCVADREVFGDFGVCMGDSVEYLPEHLTGPIVFDLNNQLLQRCEACLAQESVAYYKGTFVTVNSVSGHRLRGDFLQENWDGLCENMEGGAVAYVSRLFSLELFEMRCISNMVEDRNPSSWKLTEASEKAASTIEIILDQLQ